MAIKKFKPTTPGQRSKSVADFSGLTKKRPEKRLTEANPKKAGRNNNGRPIGIPYDTFVTDPLEVFTRVRRKLGSPTRLSRDEQTLAVMRYIEAAATRP